MLRIRAGRQGEESGAHGDIEFTNVGSRPCVLRGLPQAVVAQAGNLDRQSDCRYRARTAVRLAGRGKTSLG
jgi:hypothetical protein